MLPVFSLSVPVRFSVATTWVFVLGILLTQEIRGQIIFLGEP